MLIAISAVLVFVSFPIVPAAAFLEYDAADVPVLLAAFTMGPGAGMAVLTLASAIQAFLFGKNGVIGFFMHMMASGALVLVSGVIYRRFAKKPGALVGGLIAGSLLMVLLMIPLNFIFTPKLMMDVPIAESAAIFASRFLGLGGGEFSEACVNAYELVRGMLLVAIVPFNLVKAGLNSVLFALCFKRMRQLLAEKN